MLKFEYLEGNFNSVLDILKKTIDDRISKYIGGK